MLLPALALWALTSAPSVPAVAVSDFTSHGASPELALALGGVAGNELSRLGTFRVQTADATRVLLGVERQRQLLGCGEACGSVDLSGLLGFDYVVTGKVTKVLGVPGAGPSFTLALGLLRVKDGQRTGSELVTTQSEAALVSSVGPAVVKLVESLLEGRQGSLLLDVSEAGAAVKVDGSVVGTTPLLGRTMLAAGPHRLSVEKEGFVTWVKDVRVSAGQVLEQSAQLLPSPDTIAAYESRSGKMRVGAWLGTTLAVAGGATFAVFQTRAASLYGDATRPDTFQYHRAALESGTDTEGTVDHRAQAAGLSAQIRSSQLISYVGAGVGAAAAVGALYFWIAGDPPGRYERFKELRLDVAPTQGGAAAALSGAF